MQKTKIHFNPTNIYTTTIDMPGTASSARNKKMKRTWPRPYTVGEGL